MRNVSMFDSNSISTLFSSLNTGRRTQGSVNNFNIDLSTYGMIKSGSYSKLMRSYYETDDPKIKPVSTSTAKDDSKTLSSIQDAAENVKDSAAKLYKADSKLFKKNDKDEYNVDDIYKAVDSFVSDYNDLVKSAGKSETSSIAGDAANMVNYIKSNSSMLSKFGITMDVKDYTLKIDEDKFKKADMSSVKSMFNGTGSFAYSVAVKASMLKSHADIEAAKSNTYNNNGNYTYNYRTGELFNSSF